MNNFIGMTSTPNHEELNLIGPYDYDYWSYDNSRYTPPITEDDSVEDLLTDMFDVEDMPSELQDILLPIFVITAQSFNVQIEVLLDGPDAGLWAQLYREMLPILSESNHIPFEIGESSDEDDG